MSDPRGDQTGNSAPPQGGSRYETARTAATALADIARSMDDLRDRIDPAMEAINHALVVSTSEGEIGKLFVRAQEYVDRAVADAQRNAAQLLVDARAEAERIVAEGHQRARQLIEQAPFNALVPTEVLQQFERTIESFNRSNCELTNQLSRLRSTLAADATKTGPKDQRASQPQHLPPQAARTQVPPPVAALVNTNTHHAKAG